MTEFPSRTPDSSRFSRCGYPFKLEPMFQERVWGREALEFLYAGRPAEPRRVGEVWLTGDANRIANGAWTGATLAEVARACGPALLGDEVYASRAPGLPPFPLLIKFLFTSDKLSVQVHPPDSYARAHENAAGKTEMWHVLRAEAGATLAIGFRSDVPRDRSALRDAVKSGAIEDMLEWMSVQTGDTFFVPAGTVHAIGPGLVICEIQQNSDITYRLYDYNRPGSDGRPRLLHVEQALDVIEWRSRGGRTRPVEWPFGSEGGPSSRLLLAACPYFVTERLALETAFSQQMPGRMEIWIGLEGEVNFETGDSQLACRKGEVVVIPADLPSFSVRPALPSIFLRTSPPLPQADLRGDLLAGGVSAEDLERVCFPEAPEGTDSPDFVEDSR